MVVLLNMEIIFDPMENEIADCLLRCETPILPPDVIMNAEDQEIPPKQETVESSEDRMKRKKLKRRQHFMRVHLKKQRETMNKVNPTPSTIPVIINCVLLLYRIF